MLVRGSSNYCISEIDGRGLVRFFQPLTFLNPHPTTKATTSPNHAISLPLPFPVSGAYNPTKLNGRGCAGNKSARDAGPDSLYLSIYA